MIAQKSLLTIILCVSVTHAFLGSSIQSRKYEFDQELPVVVESVSPFDNPSERYEYYSMPWPCKPSDPKLQRQEAGADFIGERARDSDYKLRFRRTTTKQYLCDKKKLSVEEVNKFIDAIENRYQFEMRVDDLLVVGAIGLLQSDATSGEKSFFLLTHRTFNLTYNDDRVITCHLSREVTTQQFVELIRGKEAEVQFSFSVLWSKTEVPYSNRLWVQEQSRVTKHQLEAHWLWIVNSCMLIVLLTALFSMILLRVVKNDVARYLQLDQMHQEELIINRESDEQEPDETGWKRIQFDVFRSPSQPLLFAAIVGVGTQLLMISVIVLILSTFGYFYPGNHGRIFIALGILYCVTAYAAGFVTGAKLAEIAPDGKDDWMWTTFATSCLFCGPFFLSFMVINTLAIIYSSTVALPFMTIATVFTLWCFVTIPLTAVGAKRGAAVQHPQKPCHVKRISRPIPEDLPWYHNPIVQVLAAGFLPFMSIYVELGTLFVALWGHTAYTLFGILAITFTILLVVTAFIVVLLCYFQLVAEDHRWWWMSMARGAGCSLFMYAYAVYYWVYQSHMSGALQGSMFFLYSLMISYAFALMLGSVGHWTSRWFVITIYRAIKAN